MIAEIARMGYEVKAKDDCGRTYYFFLPSEHDNYTKVVGDWLTEHPDFRIKSCMYVQEAMPSEVFIG